MDARLGWGQIKRVRSGDAWPTCHPPLWDIRRVTRPLQALALLIHSPGGGPGSRGRQMQTLPRCQAAHTCWASWPLRATGVGREEPRRGLRGGVKGAHVQGPALHLTHTGTWNVHAARVHTHMHVPGAHAPMHTHVRTPTRSSTEEPPFITVTEDLANLRPSKRFLSAGREACL